MNENVRVFRLQPAPGTQPTTKPKRNKQLKKPVVTPEVVVQEDTPELGSRLAPNVRLQLQKAPTTRSQLRNLRESPTTSVTKKTRNPKRVVTRSNKHLASQVDSEEVNTPHEQPVDNLAQARKDSANQVLKSILETNPMSTTLQRYKPYMVLWRVRLF